MHNDDRLDANKRHQPCIFNIALEILRIRNNKNPWNPTHENNYMAFFYISSEQVKSRIKTIIPFLSSPKKPYKSDTICISYF